MHVMCVIFKNNSQFVKRTYIAFIGKAPQNVGCVIAIYESCLQQIRKDSPNIKYIIDKSDNAGCHHTEILFAWKAEWPTRNTGHRFLDTMFNERQAGKDQCDRDSATAKRQMNYYINEGNNIENANEMNQALRTATGLCGFNSCVMDIEKTDYENSDNIKNISKIHHVKYIKENDALMYRVWQYYGIGSGKMFPVGPLPCSPKYVVTVPFDNDHLLLGRAIKEKKEKKELILCSEPMCSKSFESVDKMLYHLDFEDHHYINTNVSQLSTVSDKWVRRFSINEPGNKNEATSLVTDDVTTNSALCMGWAIPKRCIRRFSVTQKNFLKLFDDGEKNNCKISPEQVLHKMKEIFDPKDFLPLTSIKSYFSRRAKNIRDGKSVIGETIPEEENEEPVEKAPWNGTIRRKKKIQGDTDEEDEDDTDEEEDQEDNMASRKKTIENILYKVENVPDLQPDDWIAVNMGSTWYPAQFVTYDAEQEELQANFLHRSSSNPKWFVWPQFQLNGEEDKSWVSEEAVFYRLPVPKEGRRMTLIFDSIEEVDKMFCQMKRQ